MKSSSAFTRSSSSSTGNAANTNNNNTQELYFQRLWFSETTTRTFHLYFQNAPLFLSLSAVVVFPIVLILCMLLWTRNVSFLTDNEEFWSNHVRDLVLVSLVALIVYLVLGVAAHAAMIQAVTEIYIGQQNQPEESSVVAKSERLLCKGLGKVGSIICFRIVLFFGLLSTELALMIVLGIVTLIFGLLLALILGEDAATIITFVINVVCHFAVYVASVYVTLGFFAVTPIIVIEGLGWQRAMERSWELTCERRLFIFGAGILNNLVVWIPCTLYFFVTVNIIDPTNIATATGAVLIFALPFMIIVPCYSIFVAVVYLNLRIDKEGCDQSVLTRDLGLEQSDDPTPSVCKDTKYSPVQIADDMDKNLDVGIV